MKHLRSGPVWGAMLVSLMASAPSALGNTASAGDPDGVPRLLTELHFNSVTAMGQAPMASSAMAAPGWTIGAQAGGSIGVRSTTSPDSASSSVNALAGQYPNPPSGGQYIWADYHIAGLNTGDVYIEFWAKMPSPAKGGCKFVKIFGERSPTTGEADVTIATDYTGVDFGSIRQISFGDGTILANDSQNVINLTGKNLAWMGRSYGTAVVKTPQMGIFPSSAWGTAWHHFRIHVKFNDGTSRQNEVPDGAFYLEIDGKVYVDATGVYNRNPANGPISYVEFFGWAQKDPAPFELMYSSIRISTGGFMSTPLPDPPKNASVK